MHIIDIDPRNFSTETPELVSQAPNLWLHYEKAEYDSFADAREGQHGLALKMALGRVAKEYPNAFTDNRSWHVDGARRLNSSVVNSHTTYMGRGFMYVAQQAGSVNQLSTNYLGDVGEGAVITAEAAARKLVESGQISPRILKIPIFSGVTAFWMENHRSSWQIDTAHAVVSTTDAPPRRSVVSEYFPTLNFYLQRYANSLQ